MSRSYDFSRCDECGAPLEPESRLWGLCPACQSAETPTPKAKAGQPAQD